MKKVLCLILAFCLLCLVGCGGDKEDASSLTGKNQEIEKQVESGRFEDAEYGIGADFDEVNNHYKKVYDDYMELHSGENSGVGHEDEINTDGGYDHENFPYYDLVTKADLIEIETEEYRFYFNAQNEDKGMIAIATDGNTLGFTSNVTTKQEVEEKVGTDGKTRNAEEADLIYLAIEQENLLVLRYEFEKHILDFYFCENTLQTTLIKVK